MGRWSTGAETTGGSKRIELSFLIKHRFIKKGCEISGRMSWNCRGEASGNIGIETRYFGDENDFIRLYYTHTLDEVKTNLDYKITLIERDSNLGKGKVLYFICNQSGKLCRILYSAYGSPYFKCREAYRHRLYYPIQTRSKTDRYNGRYFELERQLETEDEKRFTYLYKDQVTKRAIKKQRLKGLMNKMDQLRSNQLWQWLIKAGYNPGG